MTYRHLQNAAFAVIVCMIVGSTILSNKVACERGVKGRESLIALRQGFEASAHGRYEKAKRQRNPQLAVEERKEGAGLYAFAHRITVHPPTVRVFSR